MRAQGDNKNTTHRCTRSAPTEKHAAHDSKVQSLQLWLPWCSSGLPVLNLGATDDKRSVPARVYIHVSVQCGQVLLLLQTWSPWQPSSSPSFWLWHQLAMHVRFILAADTLKSDLSSCCAQLIDVFDSRFSCEQRLLHQIQQDARALPAHQRLQGTNHHGKLSHRGDHVRPQICKTPVSSPSQCGWMSALWRVKVSNSEYLSRRAAVIAPRKVSGSPCQTNRPFDRTHFAVKYVWEKAEERRASHPTKDVWRRACPDLAARQISQLF